MKQQNWIIIILVALNLGTLGTIWWLGQKPPRRFQPMGHLERELNLTPEQSAQFDTLRIDHFQGMRQLDKAIRADKEKLVELALEDSLNVKARTQILERLSQTQNEMELLLFDHIRSLGEICNEDQKIGLQRIFSRIHTGPPGKGPHKKRRKFNKGEKKGNPRH